MNPLYKLRTEEGVSYAEMARKTGFTRGYMHFLATREDEFVGGLKISTLVDMEEVLNVPLLDYFVGVYKGLKNKKQ